jgi:hypothetical protein
VASDQQLLLRVLPLEEEEMLMLDGSGGGFHSVHIKLK